MITLPEARNIEEFTQVVDQLGRDVAELCCAGPLSVQNAQQAAIAITRAHLILNELERIEVRDHGVSRRTAERFSELEHRIRTVQNELYQGMQTGRNRQEPGYR